MGERLEKYDFAVPHKSFVVNLYHIRSLKGYDIVLADGSVLPLSQKKSAVFREKLKRILNKHFNLSKMCALICCLPFCIHPVPVRLRLLTRITQHRRISSNALSAYSKRRMPSFRRDSRLIKENRCDYWSTA